MSLQFMLNSQKALQKRLGTNFETMTNEDRAHFLKIHGYFLMEETMELLRETPFHKPWKDYSAWDDEKHLNQEQLQKEEAIDIFHFMMNIFLALNMDAEEVAEMYAAKNKLNYRRQEDPSLGYVNK